MIRKFLTLIVIVIIPIIMYILLRFNMFAPIISLLLFLIIISILCSKENILGEDLDEREELYEREETVENNHKQKGEFD